jgi:hypothetical protein
MRSLSCHLAALCRARAGEPSASATVWALTPLRSSSFSTRSLAFRCITDSKSGLVSRQVKKSYGGAYTANNSPPNSRCMRAPSASASRPPSRPSTPTTMVLNTACSSPERGLVSSSSFAPHPPSAMGRAGAVGKPQLGCSPRAAPTAGPPDCRCGVLASCGRHVTIRVDYGHVGRPQYTHEHTNRTRRADIAPRGTRRDRIVGRRRRLRPHCGAQDERLMLAVGDPRPCTSARPSLASELWELLPAVAPDGTD